MKELTYPRERTLATVTLILGIIAWLILIIGTFGTALFLNCPHQGNCCRIIR